MYPGWCARAFQHAPDHVLEFRLCTRERAGAGGAELNLDGDQLARTFKGADNPAEATERDRTVRISRRILCAIDCAQELLEHSPNVVVGPRRGFAHRRQLHEIRDGVVVPAKPDFDLERHGRSVAGHRAA